jgi:hypothetical protein
MNVAACRTLVAKPENRVWYRVIQPQHWPAAGGPRPRLIAATGSRGSKNSEHDDQDFGP